LAGLDPAEAERAFYGPVIQSLRCITEPHLRLRARETVLNKAMLLAVDEPLEGPSSLRLTAHMHYDDVEAEPPAGPWRVSVREFLYEYETPSRELVYGYWYRRDDTQIISMVKIGKSEYEFTIPRMSVEELVQLGIEYLGVKALRPDWRQVLSENLEAHLAWRTS
jgi:hypothetical protein